MSLKVDPSILAVVVTYNPDADLGRNLEALRAQAGAVVVVDNGSADFAAVERTALKAGCRVIGNGANLGVATALNQAARLARAEGFEWLATFDQDSLIEPGALAGLLELHQIHPRREAIAVLAMSRRDRATGRDYHHAWDTLEETPLWRSVRTTITSGAMVRTEVFETVGLFDDRLFIDSVDHEFCLRCRRHGLLVIEGRLQLMDHSVGAGTEHRFLGWRAVCANHSPTRRYYITRNQLHVCGRYLRVDFVWSGLGLVALAGDSLAVLLHEKDRPAKVAAMLEGARDALFRRFGPRRG